MLNDFLTKIAQERGVMPNKLTLYMGEQIREAREEWGYSQAQLAKYIYRRQAAVSDMENGKMQPDAETLLLLSGSLRKPIDYFYPDRDVMGLQNERLDPMLKELLLAARELGDEDLHSVIVITRAMVKDRIARIKAEKGIID